MIVDATPYFNRWKLQPLKVPTLAEQWECTRMVLFSHFTIELPAVCAGILYTSNSWTDVAPPPRSGSSTPWHNSSAWRRTRFRSRPGSLWRSKSFCSSSSRTCSTGVVRPLPYSFLPSHSRSLPSPLAPPQRRLLQAHPQGAPQVPRAIWSVRRVRASGGGLHPGRGHDLRADPVLLLYAQPARLHRLHLDHAPPLPGRRCALWIW